MATTIASKIFWSKFRVPTPEELMTKRLDGIKAKYVDFDRPDLVVREIQAAGILNDFTKGWLRDVMNLEIAPIPRITLAGFPLGSFEVSSRMYCYPSISIDEDAHYKKLEEEEYYRKDKEYY